MASLLFLLPLALLWLLFVRPQKQRMRQAQAMVASLDVGDEIITSGGIYGTVTATDDTSLWLEITPGVVVRVLRAAVAQRVPTDLDTLVENEHEHDHEYDHDEDSDDDDPGDDGSDESDDDDVNDQVATEAPGSNGLSAGVPNAATPKAPSPEATPGDDEA